MIRSWRFGAVDVVFERVDPADTLGELATGLVVEVRAPQMKIPSRQTRMNTIRQISESPAIASNTVQNRRVVIEEVTIHPPHRRPARRR